MLLALLMLLHMKRRVLYGALMAFAVIVSIPFLPASFTNRMDTNENYKSDESASTRIAVWKWTWDYAKAHPRSEERRVGKECFCTFISWWSSYHYKNTKFCSYLIIINHSV